MRNKTVPILNEETNPRTGSIRFFKEIELGQKYQALYHQPIEVENHDFRHSGKTSHWWSDDPGLNPTANVFINIIIPDGLLENYIPNRYNYLIK